jgi:hypothetical protein
VPGRRQSRIDLAGRAWGESATHDLVERNDYVSLWAKHHGKPRHSLTTHESYLGVPTLTTADCHHRGNAAFEEINAIHPSVGRPQPFSESQRYGFRTWLKQCQVGARQSVEYAVAWPFNADRQLAAQTG